MSQEENTQNNQPLPKFKVNAIRKYTRSGEDFILVEYVLDQFTFGILDLPKKEYKIEELEKLAREQKEQEDSEVSAIIG